RVQERCIWAISRDQTSNLKLETRNPKPETEIRNSLTLPISCTVASYASPTLERAVTAPSPLPDRCAATCDNGLRCRCSPAAESSGHANQAGTDSCLRFRAAG